MELEVFSQPVVICRFSGAGRSGEREIGVVNKSWYGLSPMCGSREGVTKSVAD
jgi:hypothetical protein